MQKKRKAVSKAKRAKKKPLAKKAAKKAGKKPARKKRSAATSRARSRPGASSRKSALLREFLAAGADFAALSKILRDMGVERSRPAKRKRSR